MRAQCGSPHVYRAHATLSWGTITEASPSSNKQGANKDASVLITQEETRRSSSDGELSPERNSIYVNYYR